MQTLPLFRPCPHPRVLGLPWGEGLLFELEYFLVKQIGCGNLPVQFVGTKVAFVTQITATYQQEWGP